MNGKRVTIYHIAEALGMSGSYVSRALNGHPSVSLKIKEQVKKKATELNYKHNSHAANLRQGTSKTVGVIVPHINQSFFSDAIAGIEEVCFENNHSLIICQSQESYQHESAAIETLIHQNVDVILISISAETQSSEYLNEILKHDITLIQFDRCLDAVESTKVVNDNEEISYKAVQHLIAQGYRKIAFLGGPGHLSVFKDRKEGYMKAIREAAMPIPYNYIADNTLLKKVASKVASNLLSLPDSPDAFFAVSDLQALEVLKVAETMGIKVPEQLGVIGFANEAFTELIRPALSSIDQKSKALGKCAANLYFQGISSKSQTQQVIENRIVKSEIIVRKSSKRREIV